MYRGGSLFEGDLISPTTESYSPFLAAVSQRWDIRVKDSKIRGWASAHSKPQKRSGDGHQSPKDMWLRQIGACGKAVCLPGQTRRGTQGSFRPDATELQRKGLHGVLGSRAQRVPREAPLLPTLRVSRQGGRPQNSASRQHGFVLGQIKLAAALHNLSFQRQAT